jgi:hypothetical protein
VRSHSLTQQQASRRHTHSVKEIANIDRVAKRQAHFVGFVASIMMGILFFANVISMAFDRWLMADLRGLESARAARSRGRCHKHLR